jgi:uncharacterized protein YbjT (DUF2867 family)
MDFFTAHEKNLLAAEARAGVRHHVALSIVGADRSPDNGYLRAKVFQEELIKGSSIPFTVIRSTQFMEFLGSIADAGQKDGVINIATGLFQPIAAERRSHCGGHRTRGTSQRHDRKTREGDLRRNH